MAAVSHLPIASSSGSFLITPNVGLMIWTLLLFGISLYILWKLAFPRISEALDRRQHAIEESIDHADQVRKQADDLLAEYQQRLRDAREQAEQIIERSRKTSEAREREVQAETQERRQQMMEQTRKEIEAETRRAIQEIRHEVADLTVLATEKITRKVLDADDQRRLVEDALSELDFSALAPGDHN